MSWKLNSKMILRAGLRRIINYSKISRCCCKVLSNITSNLIKFIGTSVQGHFSSIMLTVLCEMYNCLDQRFWTCFTYLLTYLLTPCSRAPIEKLTGPQLLLKFPVFYGTRRFITAFTSACHLSLSWASSTQSTPPHPTSWRSIPILSSHLRLGLPMFSFPQVSPPKPCTLLSSTPYVLHAPPILFLNKLYMLLSMRYKEWNAMLCQRQKRSAQNALKVFISLQLFCMK
jgi:hypothetical protein